MSNLIYFVTILLHIGVCNGGRDRKRLFVCLNKLFSSFSISNSINILEKFDDVSTIFLIFFFFLCFRDCTHFSDKSPKSEDVSME